MTCNNLTPVPENANQKCGNINLAAVVVCLYFITCLARVADNITFVEENNTVFYIQGGRNTYAINQAILIINFGQ